MSAQYVTMQYGESKSENGNVNNGASSLCASGSYDSSTTEKTTITTGFRPKYLAIVGTGNGGQMIVYDERRSPDTFRYAGHSTYLETRNFGTNTNYNLYSIDSNGFTVNKTTSSYTYFWFAIG